MTRKLLPLLALLPTVGISALAQPATSPAVAPAATPTTVPATGPSTRPTLVLPEGFSVVESGGRKFLVTPADEAWVREAALHVGPATRPTTMPTDLLATVAAKNADLISGLSADLAVDPKMTGDWLNGSGDRTLKGVLDKFLEAKIYVTFMVAPIERVTQAMEKGWENPTLQYNRQMKRVFLSRVVVLADAEDSPYVLRPILYNAANLADAERGPWLSGQLAQFDTRLDETRAEDSMRIVQASLIYFTSDRGFKGVSIARDQQWLQAGIIGAVTAKYTSSITGVSRRQIIAMMTYERPGSLRASGLDLLTPMDQSQMVPELVPAFIGAVNRKSIKIIDDLALRHGDEVIPKILTALREKKPADGPALVALIKDLTGTDLTAQLRAGQ